MYRMIWKQLYYDDKDTLRGVLFLVSGDVSRETV